MSVIQFELKQAHLDLLKNLRWSLTENKFLISCENVEEDTIPFGADNLYEAMGLILKGKPDDFDPFNALHLLEISEEEKKEFDKLLAELPTALDIILYNGHFDLGTYKTRYHNRDWKKVKNQ